ncbi:MAG: hypothetical protein WD670_02005 [Actinomycetota bacterium]
MRRSTSTALIALTLVLALAAAACGKDEAKPAPGVSTVAPPPVEVVPPGEYGYSSYGVKATMVPDGEKTFSLSVSNKTGVGLGKVGIYALDAVDGHKIPGTVVDSAPVGNGQSKDFTVTFGEGFDANQVGLMLLEFGSANWGAFTSGTSES